MRAPLGDTSTITVTPSGGFSSTCEPNLRGHDSAGRRGQSPHLRRIEPESGIRSLRLGDHNLGAHRHQLDGHHDRRLRHHGHRNLRHRRAHDNSQRHGERAAASTFTLTNSGNITVSPGATSGNTSTISVTPSGGFSSSVSLTCAVTTNISSPNDPPTCGLSPVRSLQGKRRH